MLTLILVALAIVGFVALLPRVAAVLIMNTKGKGPSVRGTAEHVVRAVIRYRWPCGHTETKNHALGPPSKRMGEFAAKHLVSYWARTQGVILPPCPRCNRKRKDPR
jgi:hypothetical protein